MKQLIKLPSNPTQWAHFASLAFLFVCSLAAGFYLLVTKSTDRTTNQTLPVAQTNEVQKDGKESQPTTGLQPSNPTTPSEQTTPAPSTPASSQSTPKPTTPSPHPTYTPPPSTLTVGSLIVSNAVSSGGLCSIPASTTIRSNFTGSVTVRFTGHIVGSSLPDNSFDQYVTVHSGSDTPVQRSLSYSEPYEYTVQVTMSIANISTPSTVPYPTISYSGTRTGSTVCQNY